MPEVRSVSFVCDHRQFKHMTTKELENVPEGFPTVITQVHVNYPPPVWRFEFAFPLADWDIDIDYRDDADKKQDPEPCDFAPNGGIHGLGEDWLEVFGGDVTNKHVILTLTRKT